MTADLRLFAAMALACALALAAPVQAQQSYQGRDAGAGAERGQGDSEGVAAPRGRTRIDPYIEFNNIAVWQLSPGADVVTYTQLAAGVDASLAGRRSGGTVSLRYERNFAHQSDSSDSDTLTGLARGYIEVVPRNVTFEAGALASRTQTNGGGASVISPLIDDSRSVQTYSAYAGPTVRGRIEEVEVNANYRVGYTRVDTPDVVLPGGAAVDSFDESVSHSAMVRAGTSPGDPFPVGVGVGAGFYQEDVSNLDQRVRDIYVRGDVTVPVTPTLAVVAGAGLEDVEVSSRDAVRDAQGNPVIGSDGRYLTDDSAPRIIAYEADGLIWDVGVIWRPSRRTSLEAHFGHRYDSETFYGNFSWQRRRDAQLSINVYDGIQGFGGRLTNSLAALSPEFQVVRDPVTGELTGCTNTISGGNCLDGLLGSVRSAVFRGRGISASYTQGIGRLTAGIGAGYDQREFIAAPGTVLAAADGLTDESYYVQTNLAGPVWRGNFSVASFANWFESGAGDAGDVFALGSSASYTQEVLRNLSARAAVSFTMFDSELSEEDIRAASALLGLRYDF